MRRAAWCLSLFYRAGCEALHSARPSSTGIVRRLPQKSPLTSLNLPVPVTVRGHTSLVSQAWRRATHGVWRTISRPAPARQYQTLQFPARTGLFRSPLDADTALKALIAANVAVWVGWRADPFFMQRHFTVSLQHMRMGYYHTLVTSCFSHRDPMHLAVNMITLWFMWNRWLFPSGSLVLFLYLAGGVVGNIAFLADQYSSIKSKHPWSREHAIRASAPALGASGSVNACFIFNILAAPYQTVLIYGIVPVPAFLVGALWVYSDVSGALGGGHSGIGYSAHLGGAMTGALAWFAWSRGRLRL